MSSADSSRQLLSVFLNKNIHTSVRSPVVKCITFIPCNRNIYTLTPRVVIGLRSVLQTRPNQLCLMLFVFLGSGLCRQLLSDSPHGRHLCYWLMVGNYRPHNGLTPSSYAPCTEHL
ncbi:hypothetical protein [uncultured Bacteroides sp.]|uniref:hypothetical protein n=1 Tax=uncultured Bacteroides sp. TaxID=162156 RepID=UPI002AAABCFE|nr:hypothetical protein [uncultured Bacteroides sp.]